MLANETLVDVLSCLNRATLDTVQMVSKSFADIVDAKLVNVCLRRIRTARFQRHADAYSIVINYGVHGHNDIRIEGYSDEVEAVRDMLQMCRASTIDVLKLYDTGSTNGFSLSLPETAPLYIRTATLEALIDCAPTFVVRRISFGLAVLVIDAPFGLFMRALESTNGLKSLCPPSTTSSEEKYIVERHCNNSGIEFDLSLF